MKKRKKRPGQTQGHRPSPAWSQALALTPNQRASPRKTQWDAWISCHHRNSSTGMRAPPPRPAKKVVVYHQLKKKNTLLFVGDLSLFVKKTEKHDIFGIFPRSNPPLYKDLQYTTPPSVPSIDFHRHLRLGFQDRAASIQHIGFLLLNPHRTAGFSKVFCCGGREGTTQKIPIPTNQPTNHEMMIEKNCTPIFSTGFFFVISHAHLVVTTVTTGDLPPQDLSTKLLEQSKDPPPPLQLKILYNTIFEQRYSYPSEIHKSWGFLLQCLPLAIVIIFSSYFSSLKKKRRNP